MLLKALLLAIALPSLQSLEKRFDYVASRQLEKVSLAGTFNNWNKEATPMTLGPDGKTWSAKVKLNPGKHLYKFVLNGQEWITDPKATKNEDDGGGNLNSVLMLLPPDYAKPAKAGDGVFARSAIFHDRSIPSLNWDRGQLTMSLRTRPNDFSHLEMFVEDPAGEKCIELREVARDQLYAYHQASLTWNRNRDIRYRFMLVDGSVRKYLTPDGISDDPRRPFIVSAKTFKPFRTPEWVERTVFYQIFPDRFDNGDPSNDPKEVTPWNGDPTYYNRFGGDVAGVAKHVDYLKSLGISGIYFNPIFRSPSNHRYDATDYLEVDPEFGTNSEFYNLTKHLRQAGIRTMLDFAFNHTAVDFKAFSSIRNEGQSSPYRNWYWIKSYPVEVKENPPYVAWFNFPSMPKLNVMNPETHKFVLDVVDYWRKEAGIEGIRLDVANEVDMQMWRDLRKHVKATAPQAYILGEEWGNASAWLQGDQWDASMNYPFRDACLRFLAEQSISAPEFAKRLMANYRQYAPQVSRVQFNLLGSHDTPRFLTLCQDDRRRANLGAVVLMTWAGSPSVYYGDELGMTGGKDPENRRGMEWSKATPANPSLRFYKKLIGIRNASRALQSGEPSVVASSADGSLVYSRELGNDSAIVVLNRSEKPRDVLFENPFPETKFRDALNQVPVANRGTRLSLRIPAMSAAILRPAALKPAARPSRISKFHSRPRPVGERRKS